ncbi:MAG: AGE family epimerase/isomerase [Opitutaceae bacterium]|nr:AGE family epimerase/isomerase [Opitutaceae bacterium]
MESRLLTSYADRIEADLRHNILPFWQRHAIDREKGGIIGELGLDGRPVAGVERGSLLTSRMLWTFSSAYRLHRDPGYRATAEWMKADLVTRFWDPVHGGLYWSIDGEGKPARTRKQIYGIAFGVYALTEHYRATGSRDSLDRAISLFHAIERHAWDPVCLGYFEACSREWTLLDDWRLSEKDMNEPKSQNTHLHIMEAYMNLLRVWPADEVRNALARLLGLMLEKVLDARSHHLGLFFDASWAWRTNRISYGHDIEAAWLMTEAAEVLGDPVVLDRIQKEAVAIAEVTLKEGVDADGAILYEGLPDGTYTNTMKDWWPQIEGAIGFLNAYEIGRDERHLKAALKLWDVIASHYIDRGEGEWHQNLDRSLAVVPAAKISFWKCPYHNGRGCMELPIRLRRLAAAR